VARSGIGVGAGVAAFAVIATLILLYRWKRSAGALRQSQTLGNSGKHSASIRDMDCSN